MQLSASFPVCIYYVQRAVYLCVGQTPRRKVIGITRLDRIQQMTHLEWKDQVSSTLRELYPQNLPSPDYSEQWLKLGALISTCRKLMLLRFDREFHDRYIHGTFATKPLKVKYQQAEQLIRQHTPQLEVQQQF